MSDASTHVDCPACREPNAHTASECWLCHEPLDAAVAQQTARSVRDPHYSTSFDSSSRISYVCMFIALSIVCLGLFLLFPGIGIIFAFLIAPAMVRARNKWADDANPTQPLTARMLFLTVMGTIGTAITIGIAAVIAGCAVCIGSILAAEVIGELTPRGIGEEGIAIVIYVGVLIGVLVALIVTSKLIQRQRKKASEN